MFSSFHPLSGCVHLTSSLHVLRKNVLNTLRIFNMMGLLHSALPRWLFAYLHSKDVALFANLLTFAKFLLTNFFAWLLTTFFFTFFPFPVTICKQSGIFFKVFNLRQQLNWFYLFSTPWWGSVCLFMVYHAYSIVNVITFGVKWRLFSRNILWATPFLQ